MKYWQYIKTGLISAWMIAVLWLLIGTAAALNDLKARMDVIQESAIKEKGKPATNTAEWQMNADFLQWKEMQRHAARN